MVTVTKLLVVKSRATVYDYVLKNQCALFSCMIKLSVVTDGSDSRDKPKLYRLQLSVTEVGTEKFDDNSIQVSNTILRQIIP